MQPVLSLGEQPLANGFLRKEQLGEPEPRAPLGVQRCHHCTLLQLTYIVDPAAMFTEYRFTSGVSDAWRAHCHALLEPICRGLLLDIGSNDGTLLECAKSRSWTVLGIEPSDLAKTAKQPTIQAYWDSTFAATLPDKYDLITAQNVFAHVDDPRDFLRGVKRVLAPQGLVAIECPDTVTTLKAGHFDQIYHEHLSYWTLLPFWNLALSEGLAIFDIETLPVHGGSLRYWLRHAKEVKNASYDVRRRLDAERALSPRTARSFAIRVNKRLQTLTDTFRHFAENGQKVSAFGASAKGNVLLNTLAQREAPLPICVYDDSPLKQGCFTPGTHLPIEAPTDLSRDHALLLTSWNWAADLKRRAHDAGFRGQFLLPHE